MERHIITTPLKDKKEIKETERFGVSTAGTLIVIWSDSDLVLKNYLVVVNAWPGNSRHQLSPGPPKVGGNITAVFLRMERFGL